MGIRCERVGKVDWERCAEKNHMALFGSEGLEDFAEYSFALAIKDDLDALVGYIQVRELDSESAYITYGGSMPEFRGFGSKGFALMLEELLKTYLRVGLATKFDNVPMLKMGLNFGFKIIGMKLIRGIPYVEMLLEPQRSH